MPFVFALAGFALGVIFSEANKETTQDTVDQAVRNGYSCDIETETKGPGSSTRTKIHLEPNK
jgi:hypothetical protein